MYSTCTLTSVITCTCTSLSIFLLLIRLVGGTGTALTERVAIVLPAIKMSFWAQARTFPPCMSARSTNHFALTGAQWSRRQDLTPTKEETHACRPPPRLQVECMHTPNIKPVCLFCLFNWFDFLLYFCPCFIESSGMWTRVHVVNVPPAPAASLILSDYVQQSHVPIGAPLATGPQLAPWVIPLLHVDHPVPT